MPVCFREGYTEGIVSCVDELMLALGQLLNQGYYPRVRLIPFSQFSHLLYKQAQFENEDD